MGHCGIPSGQPCKAIGAPFFATHAVVDKEKPRGIIFRLHRSQSWVVRSPKGSLPGPIEKVALRHIGPGIRYDLSQFIHRLVDLNRIFARCSQIRLMAGNTRVDRRAPACNDRQSERTQHRGIRRGVSCRRHRFRGAPASPLLKCKATSQCLLLAKRAFSRAKLTAATTSSAFLAATA